MEGRLGVVGVTRQGSTPAGGIQVTDLRVGERIKYKWNDDYAPTHPTYSYRSTIKQVEQAPDGLYFTLKTCGMAEERCHVQTLFDIQVRRNRVSRVGGGAFA